jgi:hypothetical protein
VAILGGVIVALLVARNNALAAHIEADQILACTRLCAAQVAALRAGAASEGQGRLMTPSGIYIWRITRSVIPPEAAATDLAGYDVAVWPAPPAATDAAADSASPQPVEQPDTECGAFVTLWLPARSGLAGPTP